MGSETQNLLEVPDVARMPGIWSFERMAWRAGYRLVAGVDEAGRGPLAGPVAAAAVILPADFDPRGIADSKTLTAAQREEAFARIQLEAHCVGVGVIGADVIDRINILEASRLAMRVAVEDLGVTPELCLVDGLPLPFFPHLHKAIVKGDSLSVSIAAASIVAKVTRDRLMMDLDRQYPGYGFARHKGYATVEHLRALADLGACPEHRRSFRPCAQEQPQQCVLLDVNADR